MALQHRRSYFLERAANEANTPNTRKVLLRSAIVMSPDRGGAFDILLNLVRFGLGGQAANGKQYVLLESGFAFELPEWPGAAQDLCSRWRVS
jgi:NAD dependent epimerase/dehydratase family enzyme